MEDRSSMPYQQEDHLRKQDVEIAQATARYGGRAFLVEAVTKGQTHRTQDSYHYFWRRGDSAQELAVKTRNIDVPNNMHVEPTGHGPADGRQHLRESYMRSRH
jgi:hypothetical protein